TVACHVHGTGLIGFLPGSWDHLSCQLLDHLSACCGSGFLVLPLDLRFMFFDAEVGSGGFQGGQCG
ncbi:MAG: hypothetical protein Q8P61_00750, partial [Candidatus Nanopelagicales bacterium]|nr:hypothetical protein [Candidatus Nanopelagicales bacterium]